MEAEAEAEAPFKILLEAEAEAEAQFEIQMEAEAEAFKKFGANLEAEAEAARFWKLQLEAEAEALSKSSASASLVTIVETIGYFAMQNSEPYLFSWYLSFGHKWDVFQSNFCAAVFIFA